MREIPLGQATTILTGEFAKFEKAKAMDNSILAQAVEGLSKESKHGKKSALHQPKLHMAISPTDDKRFIVNHRYENNNMEKLEGPTSTTHAPGSLKELLEHVKQHYSDASEAAEEKAEGGTGSAAEEKAEGESPAKG